jgi:hypothetical protein
MCRAIIKLPHLLALFLFFFKKYCSILWYQLYLSIRSLDITKILRGVSLHIVISYVNILEQLELRMTM